MTRKDLYRETWEHHNRGARMWSRLAAKFSAAGEHDEAARCASHAVHAAKLRDNIGATR